MGRFSFHMITSTGFGCVTMFISIRQSLQISEKTGEFFFYFTFHRTRSVEGYGSLSLDQLLFEMMS